MNKSFINIPVLAASNITFRIFEIKKKQKYGYWLSKITFVFNKHIKDKTSTQKDFHMLEHQSFVLEFSNTRKFRLKFMACV